MLNKNRLILLFAATICTVSCSKSNKQDDSDPSQATVALSTSLKASNEVKYLTSGSDINLDQLPQPKMGDFAITITRGTEVAAEYAKFSDMPQKVNLRVGQYTLKATYGEQVGAAWNTVDYLGEQEFTLSNSQTQANINLECKINTAFAFARFDDKFLAVFDEISAKISTEHTASPLVFANGETRIGCFKPSQSLIVLVDVTMRSTGKRYTYGIEPVVDFRAGDLHLFNFTVLDGTVGLTLTTDNGVEVVEKAVTLDPDWLATRQTKLTTSYDENNTITNIFGLPYNQLTDIVVTSNIGLKSLYVKFDKGFAAILGTDSINMLNMSEQEKLIVDSELGIKISDNNAPNYRVDLKYCINNLKLHSTATENYNFVIGAVDLTDKNVSKQLKVELIPPQFTRQEQDQNKVWNRFAYIPYAEVTNVSQEEKSHFPVEYLVSEDSGVSWESLGLIPGVQDVYINDLKPNTTYTSRASFKGVIIGESSFTTKTETPITNGNFDEPEPLTWSYNGRAGRLGADFDGQWATLNDYTTMNRTNDLYFRSYPCVHMANGVTGKAAAIEVVGWGAKAVYQHYKGSWFLDPDTFTRTPDKATAGKLFLGTYNYDATSEEAGQSQGVMFSQHPSALSFQYKYSPVNGNAMDARIEILADQEVIGSGQCVIGTTTNGFVKHTITIVYTPNGLTTKATSMRLCFSAKSSAAVTADLVNNDGTVRSTSKGKTVDIWDARFTGSLLTIDDVELVYPQNFSDFTIE